MIIFIYKRLFQFPSIPVTVSFDVKEKFQADEASPMEEFQVDEAVLRE